MELSKVGLLLAKTETTYGTDPTPVAATNNIGVVRGQVNWAPGLDNIDRDILDAGHGRVAGISTLNTGKISFRVELRGNRTDGTAADISKGNVSNPLEIDPLLQACDLNPTYTGETSGGARDGYVTYQPVMPAVGTPGKSVAFYLYSQKKRYILLGAKGNISAITLEAGKFGYIDFEFMGLTSILPPNATIPASPAFLATKPPLLAGTSLFAYNASSAAVVNKLDFKLGNQVVRREDLCQATYNGVAGFVIADRDTQGSFEPESDTEGTGTSFWGDWINAQTRSLVATIGTQTGNKITITSLVRPVGVSYSDANGKRMQPVQFAARTANPGDAYGSEFTLKFG